MKIFKYSDIKESKDSRYLLFYAFDWDDNILHMPTEIITVDENGEEVGIATNDFAKYRNLIGKEPFEYKGKMVVSFPKDKNGDLDFDRAFSNFRDFNPNVFINDVKRAISDESYGPAWDDFVECLVHGSLFAIITARGHEPETIREAVEYIIDEVLDEDQKMEMYNYLMKYAYDFKSGEFDRIPRGKFTDNDLVKLYLDNCDFVGVSAPSRGGTPDNPEKAKEEALVSFKSKVNKFAQQLGMKAMIGFSDDDPGNVKHVEELFKNLDNEEYSHIIHYVVKNTNKPEEVTKMTRTVEKIKTYSNFIKESDDTDKGMYVDVETDKEAIKSNKKELTTMGGGSKKRGKVKKGKKKQ